MCGGSKPLCLQWCGSDCQPTTPLGYDNGWVGKTDLFEVIESRFSCRAYLDKPDDPGIVREVIERAGRAASNANLQPWLVHALTGRPLEELKRVAASRGRGSEPTRERIRVRRFSERSGGAVQIETRDPWCGPLRFHRGRPSRSRTTSRVVSAELRILRRARRPHLLHRTAVGPAPMGRSRVLHTNDHVSCARPQPRYVHASGLVADIRHRRRVPGSPPGPDGLLRHGDRLRRS